MTLNHLTHIALTHCCSYGAPEPAYSSPVEEYAPVSEEYSSPAYSAEGEVIDIGSLVLPMLVILGKSNMALHISSFDNLLLHRLSTLTMLQLNTFANWGTQFSIFSALFLLFPNYINLTTVRRSFHNNGPMQLLDQVKDVAQAVLEDKDILTKYD